MVSSLLARLLGSTESTGPDHDIGYETSTFGLKRGDFCIVLSRVGSLRSGTEVMVSSVYKDKRHCRVVDYGRRYHKVHEALLDKI